MVIWAGNFVVVKAAIGIVPPVGYSLVRFLLAGLILLAICQWQEGSVKLPRSDILPLFVIGAMGFGVYQILWPTALSTTTAGNSALLVASTPIFTALVAAASGADVLTRRRLLGAVVAFAGVGLVVAAGHGLGAQRIALGDVLTLVAALCWAIYVSFGAPILRRHSPLRTTAWAILFGTIVMLPPGAWQLAGVDWARVPLAPAGLAVLYSGLLAGSIGNVIVLRGVQLLGPTRITNLQFVPPAVAVVLAAIFLGESIQIGQIAGGLVIVAGILIARHERKSHPRAAIA